MKSPLEQIPVLEETICQLRKIDSKLDVGQVIRAFRENGKLLAFFERSKKEIINANKGKKIELSNDDNILTKMQDIEEVIRQLHKINSLMYAGQIVAAYGCNNKLTAALRNKLYAINKRENDEE